MTTDSSPPTDRETARCLLLFISPDIVDRRPAGCFPPGRTGFPSMRRANPAEDGVALAGGHAEGDIFRRNQNFGPHQAA